MKHLLFLSALLALPAALAAQDLEVEFSEVEHDMGTLVWHNPAAARFMVTNTGREPVTIIDVEPDCGCTMVDWTQTAIDPGKVGTVTVRYDAEMLGHFSKSVAVYTNRSDRPHYVSVSGNVVNRDIPQQAVAPTRSLPCRIGDVELSTDDVEFDDVERGQRPVREIEIVNKGTETVRPNLMHLPRYVAATCAPEEILPGYEGKMLLTLNSELVPSMGLTQQSIYLSTQPGQRISPDNEINLSITLLPDLSGSDPNSAYIPALNLTPENLQLGRMGSKSKLKANVEMYNGGTTPLTISALQVYNPGISVTAPATVKPGAKAKIKVVVSNEVFRYKGRPRILLITNDPRQPKRVINIDVQR